MKSFTDIKEFHKLNFMKTSQLPEICGIGINTPYCTETSKLKLCDKQLRQHRIDNRWCNLSSDLGYWLQICNFFSQLIAPNCYFQICYSFFFLLSLLVFPLLAVAFFLLLLLVTVTVSLPTNLLLLLLSFFLLFITSYTHRKGFLSMIPREFTSQQKVISKKL